MISAKKLIRFARKWQKLAAMKRKRISFTPNKTSSSSSTARKGHFAAYTTDGTRFELPLAYLQNNIVRELFMLAEEEFGLPSDGPLTFPCDASLMKYIVSLIERHVSEDLEEALVASMATKSRSCAASSYEYQAQNNHQSLVHGF